MGGDLTITEPGKIYVMGRGYNIDKGPGNGSGSFRGGSHGGLGGKGNANVTYGDAISPNTMGSGGDAGAGGGVVKLAITGAMILDGDINTNGDDKNGSGAAGSIDITTGTFSGSGNLKAVGGYHSSGGNGGGGRIAVKLSSTNADFSSYTGTYQAKGGNGSSDSRHGAAGSLYLKTADQSLDGGDLIYDNSGITSGSSNPSDFDGEDANTTTVGSFTVKGSTYMQILDDNHLIVTGNVDIQASSTLDIKSGGSITVHGDWHNSGTLVTQAGANVILAGSAQTIYDDNTFATLSAAVPGSTIYFESGSTTTVSENLIMTGGAGQQIQLRSTTDGVTWNLDVQGGDDLDYLDVKDSSHTTGGGISTQNSTDSGNNTDWLFP